MTSPVLANCRSNSWNTSSDPNCDPSASTRISSPTKPGPSGPIGVIKEGAYADLILVDGDPTQGVSVLADPANVDLVMIDGTIRKDEVN